MTSQQIQQEMQTLGSSAPDFKTQVTQAYESPVLKPLVNERANLEAGYLPAMFEPFTQMGTEASDMSPAAKLAGIGGSLGRLSSRIGANQNIQNFYGAQIDRLAANETNKWQSKYNMLKDQYQMAREREEAETARRAQAAQMAAMYGGGGGGGSGAGDAGYTTNPATGQRTPITIGTDRPTGYSPGLGGLIERGAKGYGDLLVGIAGNTPKARQRMNALSIEGLLTGDQRNRAAASRADSQRLQAGVSDSLVRQYGAAGANQITQYARTRGLPLTVAMRELAAQGIIG